MEEVNEEKKEGRKAKGSLKGRGGGINRVYI